MFAYDGRDAIVLLAASPAQGSAQLCTRQSRQQSTEERAQEVISALPGCVVQRAAGRCQNGRGFRVLRQQAACITS
jgi:hypothetical protein